MKQIRTPPVVDVHADPSTSLLAWLPRTACFEDGEVVEIYLRILDSLTKPGLSRGDDAGLLESSFRATPGSAKKTVFKYLSLLDKLLEMMGGLSSGRCWGQCLPTEVMWPEFPSLYIHAAVEEQDKENRMNKTVIFSNCPKGTTT